MIDYTNITCCRLCKSEAIKEVIDFGDLPLANGYVKTPGEKEDFYPLTLVRCVDCGHVQIRETVNPKTLFANYSYASSDSPSLLKHFEEYSENVLSVYRIDGPCIVSKIEYPRILEIASNDGILLDKFNKLGVSELVGVEPASNLAQVAREKVKEAYIYNDFFNLEVAQNIENDRGNFDIICANNVFAHVAELHSIFEGVDLLLSEDGILVFENAHLLDMIQGKFHDLIYHEHLSYFGIKPLAKYLASYGLEIFHISHNNSQGGSFRIFAKRILNHKYEIKDSVARFLAMEEKAGLYLDSTYYKFENDFYDLYGKLSTLISDIIEDGKTISCYGCSAKFALFSNKLNLEPDTIKYVVDDSPLKQNLYSPGCNIPIVNSEYFKKNPTDYCIISAWNLVEPIIKRNPEYSGKWISPVPEPKIL